MITTSSASAPRRRRPSGRCGGSCGAPSDGEARRRGGRCGAWRVLSDRGVCRQRMAGAALIVRRSIPGGRAPTPAPSFRRGRRRRTGGIDRGAPSWPGGCLASDTATRASIPGHYCRGRSAGGVLPARGWPVVDALAAPSSWVARSLFRSTSGGRAAGRARCWHGPGAAVLVSVAASKLDRPRVDASTTRAPRSPTRPCAARCSVSPVDGSRRPAFSAPRRAQRQLRARGPGGHLASGNDQRPSRPRPSRGFYSRRK